MTKAHRILELEPACGTSVAKERWRFLAGIHHPDRGGNVVEFTTFRDAYQAVKKYEEKLEAKCSNCDGEGYTVLAKGFSQSKMKCSICKGTGTK